MLIPFNTHESDPRYLLYEIDNIIITTFCGAPFSDLFNIPWHIYLIVSSLSCVLVGLHCIAWDLLRPTDSS